MQAACHIFLHDGGEVMQPVMTLVDTASTTCQNSCSTFAQFTQQYRVVLVACDVFDGAGGTLTSCTDECSDALLPMKTVCGNFFESYETENIYGISNIQRDWEHIVSVCSSDQSCSTISQVKYHYERVSFML